MSYGVQSASLFGSTSQTGDTSGSSLRPFANLDLTEDQRSQIRAIFKNAKSQGLSQSEIEQEINAILTPTQQTTLQSDIAAQNSSSGNSSTSGNSTSSDSSSTQSTQGPPNPFSDPNGPFANLDLTSSQQSQIATILQNAQSQGLSISQINSQINAVLTTSQQSTFATDLQNLPAPPGSQNSSSSSSSSAANDPLANLDLTSSQQTQINTILANAKKDGTSQADILTQIEAILTPTQQSTLLQDVQTAQAIVSGHSHSGSGGTSSSSTSSSTSTATLSNGLTETDIQNQVAAATSLILQQFQYEVGLL